MNTLPEEDDADESVTGDSITINLSILEKYYNMPNTADRPELMGQIIIVNWIFFLY